MPPENNDFALEVIYSQGNVQVAFNSRWTVNECIRFFSGRYFIKKDTLNGPNQYGFQIPPVNESEDDAVWLVESQPISSYTFSERVIFFFFFLVVE